MTFLDTAPPTATAGLPPAVEGFETADGEMIGIGFEAEAIDRNFWGMRNRRTFWRQQDILGDISEAVYGDRAAWNAVEPETPGTGIVSMGEAYRAGERAAQDEAESLKSLFRDLEDLRSVDPGAFANFPSSPEDLEAVATEQVRGELREEREDLERRRLNRSSPNLTGAAAEFVGMAGAAVSDAEGIAILPLGGGTANLGRAILVEALLGAGSEALAIPAYQDQAEFLGRDAPDPLVQLLFGASFGAALPVAGRAVKIGGGAALRGGRASNRALLAAMRKIKPKSEARGAANELARREATLDAAPSGVDPEEHAGMVDDVAAQLEGGDPVIVRPEDIEGPDNWPAIQAGIFAGESGGDYDALFGFSNRDGGPFSAIRVTDMTVDEAIAFSDPSGTYGQWVKSRIGRVATPMGAYQVVGTTLRAAKKAMGLTGAERMDVALQDRIGKWILKTQGTGAWEGYRGPRKPGSVSYDGQGRFTGRRAVPIDGQMEFDFDGAAVRASADGFDVKVGDVEFHQPWRGDAAPDTAEPEAALAADVSPAEGSNTSADPDAVANPGARSAEVVPTQDEIREAVEAYQQAVQTRAEVSQGDVAAARAADAEVTSAFATLRNLDRLPESRDIAGASDADPTQLARVSRAPGRIAEAVERGDDVADIMAGDDVRALAEGIAPEFRRPVGSSAGVDTVGAAEAIGPGSPDVDAAGSPAQADLFDDPVDSQGSIAQVDLIERELQQRLAEDPDMGFQVMRDGEIATVRLADIMEHHAEEAEFLEQLNLCMPKGVSNG